MHTSGSAPGITFRETMAGPFSLGETNPQSGARKGKADGTTLTIRPLVNIDNLDVFHFDREHTAQLESSVHFPQLFGETEPTGTGIFNLFAPQGNTRLKLMKYAFEFSHDNQPYFFYGEKKVEDDPGPDVWQDTTTLFSTLHQGHDRSAPIIGAGTLRISLTGFLRQLMTMEVTHSESRIDKLSAYLFFANFFLKELRDTYFRKRK
ncbi:MAG TPA: hypothetical protein VFQ34_05290 [Nitrospiraceae bacterium]|nr:hypothetical protein [Nitrospiraceae bacterium]